MPVLQEADRCHCHCSTACGAFAALNMLSKLPCRGTLMHRLHGAQQLATLLLWPLQRSSTSRWCKYCRTHDAVPSGTGVLSSMLVAHPNPLAATFIQRTWRNQYANQVSTATPVSEAVQTSPPALLKRAQPLPPASCHPPVLSCKEVSRLPASPRRYLRCQTRLHLRRPSAWTRTTVVSRAVMRLSTRTIFRSRCRYGSTPTARNTLSKATS